MEEPRKSEIEFKEQLSKLLVKYILKGVSKRRMAQFLREYADAYKEGGVRAS